MYKRQVSFLRFVVLMFQLGDVWAADGSEAGLWAFFSHVLSLLMPPRAFEREKLGKPPVGVLPTPDKSSTATEQPVPALWRDDIIDGGGLSYPNTTDRVQQQQEAVRAEEQAAAELATAIAKELKRLHGVPFVPPTAFRDNLGADTALSLIHI